MEFLDLEHGHAISLSITRHELGTGVIHPSVVTKRHVRIYMTQQGLTLPPAPGTPISIQVPILRLWGTRLDAASRAPYWDVSSKHLIADLQTRLNNNGGNPLTVVLTAHGVKPTKRYSVEVG